LGSSYLKKKKYDMAYKSFLKAEKTANEMNSSTGLCITYNNLSELFHATGNHEKTIFYAQAAFDLSLKNKLKPQIRDASKMLYEHYKENGNPKKALYFLEYYSDYKDSLLNAENIRETKSVEFKYKLANNKKEIALLQKQNEIKQKQNALQQILLYGSIGFLALSLIYIVYYVKQVKTVRKLNLHLVETNFKIDKQNDLISEQAKGLEKLNDIKDKVISVISHDVKSPIASLYALMDLVINEPDRKSSDSMIHMAKASLKNVSLLLENLLTWAKVQIQNSDEDVPEKIDLHLIVSEVLSIYSSVALQKDVMLVNKVQQNNSISTYKNSILIIIRNLVSNAIKFSPGGESVIIQCNTEGTDILIQVIDKGIGMTKAELDKLFNVARLYTALGTCGEKGSGLGLIFVKDAVDRCRGTLKINSEKHRGTTFSCLLPDLA
jgi:signal transduction histidine kinase